MVPAKQHLKPRRPIGATCLEDGLPNQRKLIAVERMLQARFQSSLFAQIPVHLGLEEREPVLAGPLRPVEGDVRVAQQRFRPAPVTRKQGNTYRGRDVHLDLAALELIWRRDRRNQSLGKHPYRIGIGGLILDDHELIATKSRCHIAGADGLLEPLGDLTKE